MMLRLRFLERSLVRERAFIAVTDIVDDFLLQWDRALGDGAPTPDPFDFIRALTRAGFYLPTTARAFNYLDDCRRKATKPAGELLVRTLLPPASFHASSR